MATHSRTPPVQLADPVQESAAAEFLSFRFAALTEHPTSVVADSLTPRQLNPTNPDWNHPMAKCERDVTTPCEDLGTPIYDELAGIHASQPKGCPASAARSGSVSSDLDGLAVSATVLDLFARLKWLDKGHGWNGGDVVESLNIWFDEFGIDVDADETAAAQELRIPTWLARALKVPGPEKPTVVIHLRTDHERALDIVRLSVTRLTQELGEDTTAAVFDLAGDQIASIAHREVSWDEA